MSPLIQLQLSCVYHAEFVIYEQSIKKAFRDPKSLLMLNNLMNKYRTLMEKMVTSVVITYAIGLFLDETLCSHLFSV
jgi:hypothetical protein